MTHYILFAIMALMIMMLVYVGFFMRTEVDNRLEEIENANKRNEMLEDEDDSTNKKQVSIRIPDKARKAIVSSGIKIRSDEFVLVWLTVAFIPPILIYIITNNALTGLVSFGVCAVLPLLYLENARKKRMAAFGVQLGDAIMLLANGLRAGFSFEQVLDNVAAEMPTPISEEFSRVTRELRMGMSLENSLNSLTERMNNSDMKLLTSAVLIQRQVGGNLADILDTIAVTIQDRIKIKNNIKTLTAQGRVSGFIIGVIPVFLFIAISVINKEYMSMFYESDIGKILLAVAIGMEICGFIVIKKIITIEM